MKKIPLSKISEINRYVIGWMPITIGVVALAMIAFTQLNGCTVNPTPGNALTIGIGFATLSFMSRLGKLMPDKVGKL